MTARKFITLCVAAVLIASCSTQEKRDLIESRTEQAQQGLDRARLPAPPLKHESLVVTDEVWGGNRSIRMRRGQPLPKKFEQPRAVTLIAAEPMTLGEILNILSAQTGLPMRSGGELGSDSEGGGGTAGTSSSTPMQVTYEGTLSGLLEQVANFYGMNWHFDGVAVTFMRYETRMFVIEALPGRTKTSDSINADQGGQNTGSNTTGSTQTNALEQENQTESEFDFWKEITAGVNSLLGGVGTAVVSQSTGTITVTTSSEVMKTVADFLEQQNGLLSKQISINVEVYTVDLDNSDSFTVSLETALKRIAPFTFDISGAEPFSLSSAGSFAVSIIDNRNYGRVDTIANALSSVGNTVRVAQFPMTTLNNRPVSRRIGRDRTYLAQVQTNTSQTFQDTTLTPGTIREGFSLQLTPRILADGRMLLQYSLNLTDIVTIRDFTSGGNTVQLPETTNRIFVQQSLLKSGSTLILAGFNQDQNGQSSRGIGDAFNYLLGGGVQNTEIRQMLFIAITPQEIDIPRAE